MPRISRCDKLPEQDRLRLIGRIGEGASWRVLQDEFGIPQATIREWAERNGYGRSPVTAKRRAVDDILAKTPDFEIAHETAPSAETGNPEIDAAAERDAKVGRLASGVCVAILKRAAELVKHAETPRDLVAVSTATEKAWATYARVNKLDDAPPAAVVPGGTFRFLTSLGDQSA